MKVFEILNFISSAIVNMVGRLSKSNKHNLIAEEEMNWL